MPVGSRLSGPAAGVMAGAAWLAVAAAAAAQHPHEVIEIGQTAGGALALHTHASMPLAMPPSALPGFDGFVMIELAFESLQAPNAHGQFPLPAGADIRIVVDAVDPGLTLYHGLTPLGPGGELPIGAPFFHYLPVWQVNPGTLGQVYAAVIHARDAAGLLSDSPPMAVSFTPVPPPAAWAPLGGAAVVLAGRRRRSSGSARAVRAGAWERG